MIYGFYCTTPTTRIKLSQHGRLTRIILLNGEHIAIRHNGLTLFTGYANGNQVDNYPCGLLLDPGNLVITGTGRVHLNVFIDTDEFPTPEYSGWVEGVELPKALHKEQGPSAVEGAQGINPRKVPPSVGLSYTDDELDALFVDAQRP